MSKLIKITLLLITAFGLSAAVAKLRKIPAPVIDTSSIQATSSGSKLVLKGNGFIKNFTKAHKIILKQKTKKKKFRIKAISSSSEELELQLPDSIDYGDYDLHIFLRTKFFKSKRQRFRNLIKIRPQAPKKPKLKFYVVKNKNELVDIIDQEQEHNLILKLEKELEPGINTVRSFYYEDGFQSLMSEPVDVFFLAESDFKEGLEINSEQPLKSFARSIKEDRFNVSDLTHKKETGLTRSYHLITPTDNEYLAKHIKLSSIYIRQAHVKSPEYLIVKNRDNKDFSLSACHIDDEVTTRYKFEDFENIPAQTEIKIEGKLSLNDTGDSISIICLDKVIHTLEYSKADAEGFAL